MCIEGQTIAESTRTATKPYRKPKLLQTHKALLGRRQ